MIFSVLGLMTKLYYVMNDDEDRDINIMIYCAPIILAVLIRIFKNTNDASPCFSLT